MGHRRDKGMLAQEEIEEEEEYAAEAELMAELEANATNATSSEGGAARRRARRTGRGANNPRGRRSETSDTKALEEGDVIMDPDTISDFEEHCNLKDLGPGGDNLTCISTVPQEHCFCKNSDEEKTTEGCMHHNCGEGLCFKTRVSPISDIHGFSHMGKAGLTVIALFFQKSWSTMMDLCLQALSPGITSGIYAYGYFFLVVIMGSFCLLNLTVATVGSTYQRVKKASEAKKAQKEAEIAQRDKVQAERDEMKEKQKAEKKAAGGDDDDEDDSADVTLLFDQLTARKCWALGIVGIPFAHRIYFKGWYAGWWFTLRCLTFNYCYVGWVIDGLALDAVNQTSSEAEIERRQATLDKRKKLLETELIKIAGLQYDPRIIKLSKFLAYPTVDYPWKDSQAYLTRQFELFKAENPKMFPKEEETDVGKMEDLEDLEDSSDDGSSNADEAPAEAVEEGSQSVFAWFADFVVVANAGTLAMGGFDDSLNIYLEAVGYFASIFFIMEAIVKSKVL
ncbi:hypothetical protein T484DRAFT_1770350 [Baffinella frigidus]|nr:hypothetical protein T484DRAFT_1770350 [Cryptophyta sp. CCMP2293]